MGFLYVRQLFVYIADGRWVICGAILAIGDGVVALRPGGRSVFTVIWDLCRYIFGSKEYLDEVAVIVSSRTQADIDREAATKAAETLLIDETNIQKLARTLALCCNIIRERMQQKFCRNNKTKENGVRIC